MKPLLTLALIAAFAPLAGCHKLIALGRFDATSVEVVDSRFDGDPRSPQRNGQYLKIGLSSVTDLAAPLSVTPLYVRAGNCPYDRKRLFDLGFLSLDGEDINTVRYRRKDYARRPLPTTAKTRAGQPFHYTALVPTRSPAGELRSPPDVVYDLGKVRGDVCLVVDASGYFGEHRARSEVVRIKASDIDAAFQRWHAAP